MSEDRSIRESPVSEIARDGGATVVRLTGEIDLYNAHLLRKALRKCTDEDPERIVVDLGDVTFVDSTALGVLVEARRLLRNRDGFLLAAPGLEPRRALEVSGLDRHFTVHETLEAALAADV